MSDRPHTITVYMPAALHRDAKTVAVKTGQKLSPFICEAVRAWVMTTKADMRRSRHGKQEAKR